MKTFSIILIALLWIIASWPLYLSITKGYNKPYDDRHMWFFSIAMVVIVIGCTILIVGYTFLDKDVPK